MLRNQVKAWFARYGWALYALASVAFLANMLVQFAALNRGDGGPATLPALIFSVLGLLCAVVVGVVLFRGRPER
ncbi:MAG: hypothetical protein RI885_731 [Actinomycetota bacterium]|jgi:hypothetical protein